MDAATATDNCGEVTITVEEVTTAGACAGDYVITRTFTATDDCGNATTATQTITIVDTTSPVLTIPSDYTAECSDEHPMDQATVNCGEVLSLLKNSLLWALVLATTLSLVRSQLLTTVVTLPLILRRLRLLILLLQNCIFRRVFIQQNDATDKFLMLMIKKLLVTTCGDDDSASSSNYYELQNYLFLQITRMMVVFTAEDDLEIHVLSRTAYTTQPASYTIDSTAPVGFRYLQITQLSVHDELPMDDGNSYRQLWRGCYTVEEMMVLGALATTSSLVRSMLLMIVETQGSSNSDDYDY